MIEAYLLDRTMKERFASYVHKHENGCWIWQGACSDNEYGQFRYKEKTTSVHRMSWFMCRGEIPKGLKVCHTCDRRSCVNPAHLFLGTDRDNHNDMVAKGRAMWSWK